MKRGKMNWKRLLICILIPLAAGGIGALLMGNTMGVYERVIRPPLSPPPLLFPIVWGILYILMGISSYLVLQADAPAPVRRQALGLYGAQLFVNALWPFLFFRLQAFLPAFLWLLLLWVLVLLMVLRFFRIRKAAGWLQLPYLLWLTFAAYLNFAIWLLNR